MTWMFISGLIGIGVLAGISAGIFGVGGGIILVPMMVLVLGYAQHMANGTSLVALLLPVGILGVMEYYQRGKNRARKYQSGAHHRDRNASWEHCSGRASLFLFLLWFCARRSPCFSSSRPSNSGSRDRSRAASRSIILGARNNAHFSRNRL